MNGNSTEWSKAPRERNAQRAEIFLGTAAREASSSIPSGSPKKKIHPGSLRMELVRHTEPFRGSFRSFRGLRGLLFRSRRDQFAAPLLQSVEFDHRRLGRNQ